MQESFSGEQFDQLLPSIFRNYQAEIFESMGINIEYEAMPVTRIHLHSDYEGEPGPIGNMSFIYIFLAVILLMLIIVSINYMNLSVARSVRRAREVGIRKVMGSGKRNLVVQFLSESISHAAFAMILSVIVVYLTLPLFNRISGKELDPEFVFSPLVLGGLMLMSIFIGITGGSYPAFYLSAFNPVNVLKIKINSGKGTQSLRKVLVVFQFTVSTFMILSTWIVYDQLNYLKNTDAGFEKEDVIWLRLSNQEMINKSEVFKEKLLQSPAIKVAGTSSTQLGYDSPKVIFEAETSEGMQERGINFFTVDHDFLETAGIQILEGRGFSKDNLSDTTRGVLVNQVLADRLKWDQPIDKKVITFNDTIPARVVGLFRNFHQTGMYNPLESLMLIYRVNNSNVYVKARPGQASNALAYIENVWNELFPSNPFEYMYLDEQFNRQFEADEMRGRIFTFFSVLTILIACLGLFSLAAYTVEQRSREIGIRKVMGATAGRIVRMLLLSYLSLVSVSVVLAVVAGYFFGSKWLDRFVYKDALEAEAFVIAALITIILTVVTVSYHALKASLTNPASVLKDE